MKISTGVDLGVESWFDDSMEHVICNGSSTLI